MRNKLKGISMMKILLLGLLYQKGMEAKVLAKSSQGLQTAANTYQWRLINGLDQAGKAPVTIYSTMPVGTYPKNYKQLFLPTGSWEHTEGAKDLEIGGINLPILKQTSRYYYALHHVKKWCMENQGEDLVIMIYSMYLPFLKALVDVKNKYPKLHICIIVPDLPNAFGVEGSKYSLKRKVLQTLEDYQYKYTQKADSYILLTKDMINPLKIIDKPYTVIEGIASNSEPSFEANYENTTILMYSGAIQKQFGIDKLIEAFCQLTNQSYQLWICGSGDEQLRIEEAARNDSRITYFGYLTPEEVKNLQLQATILVNPRTNEGEYTKYSFPSKTIEYMESGKPVLTYKLDGIPEEYDEYLNYISGNSVEDFSVSIAELSEKSPKLKEEMGKRAYEFIQQNKNPKAQAEKVIRMLEDSVNKKAAIKHKRHESKRILQINITYGYGSTGRIVEQVHNFLEKEGYQSFVAYSAFNSTQVDTFKIENQFQNYLRRGLNRTLGRRYGHSLLGTRRLIQNIKKISPDLIHLHNIQQNSVDFPRLFKFLKNYGVPVVYTLHDCWAFTGGCYHFTTLGCKGYLTGCNEKDCKLPAKEKDIYNHTTQWVYQNKKAAFASLENLRVVCVSQWLKSCAEQSLMRNLPLQVIENGIDTSVFRPMKSKIRSELGLLEEDFVILGVANQWENKGLPIFFKLSAILKPPYRIVLVGINGDECPDNILAIPRTENIEELVRLYSMADVFFQASLEETFGLTAAEAMACGTPVITYLSTACSEVADETTGIQLKTRHKKELLQALEMIRVSGKETYSHNCVERIHHHFSKDLMLNRYLELYEELLKEKEAME